MSALEQTIKQVQFPAPDLATAAQDHLDNLTKPRGSLGRLEEIARDLAVMRGDLKLTQPNPAVAVFAADHGVTASGVSLYPREVTAQMVLNFINGGAGINVLARQAGAAVRVVDVGVDFDFDDLPGLTKAKIARGTANMAQGPAMTRDQAVQALEVGIKAALELADQGHDLLIPGDMGIGNTTAASALTAVFCGLPAEQVTGRGTGLDDKGLAHKVGVLKDILALHRPNPDDPLGVLANLGGLEIAAIGGLLLGAASRRLPVIVDGFISTAGALAACRLCPPAASYLFVGHSSVEIGHQAQCQALGKRPLLNLDLRLGEGTGAALAVNLVRAAVAIYNEMATFASAGVSDKEEQPA